MDSRGCFEGLSQLARLGRALRRGAPPSNISLAARTGGGEEEDEDGEDADKDGDDKDGEDKDGEDDGERGPSPNEPSRGSSGRLWDIACGAWVS